VDGLYGMLVIHEQASSIPQHTAMLQDLWVHHATSMHVFNAFDIHFK
jgi:hypothetical protein